MSFNNIETKTINFRAVPARGSASDGPINEIQLSDGAGGFLDSNMSVVNGFGKTNVQTTNGDSLQLNGTGYVRLNESGSNNDIQITNNSVGINDNNGNLLSMTARGTRISTSIHPINIVSNADLYMDAGGVLTLNNTSGMTVYVAGSVGTAGQVLATNGTGTSNAYWADISPPAQVVVAQIPVWQAGSLSAFVSNQAPISPWFSSASVDSNIVTGNYGEGQWFVFPNTPDSSFNIGYDFGTQPAGNYELIFVYKSYSDGCILTISEINTSLNIGSVDTFVPPTGSTNTFGTSYFHFIWSSSGDMKINFSSATHNAFSSGYNFALVGNIALLKIS